MAQPNRQLGEIRVDIDLCWHFLLLLLLLLLPSLLPPRLLLGLLRRRWHQRWVFSPSNFANSEELREPTRGEAGSSRGLLRMRMVRAGVGASQRHGEALDFLAQHYDRGAAFEVD